MQQQAEGSVVCAKHEGEGAYIVNGTLWKVSPPPPQSSVLLRLTHSEDTGKQTRTHAC